ncbi:MAG: ParB/RepB/Spo0J family partition protein [bacterium]
MAVKRLGKGLSALIPEMTTEDVEHGKSPERLREIAVAKVSPNPFQPRETFDPIALQELKQSISQNGVIQPITVREVESGYELIAGERRLRAVSELGHDLIPAYVLEVESDQQMIELSLIENIQRENLNPLDEANGYRTLITECGLTQEDVAKRVGKDRSTITNAMRLLKLPQKIQESLIGDEITSGHARAFLALEEPSEQISLWQETLQKQYSVRQVEKLIQKKKSPAKPKQKAEQEVSPFIREIEDKLRTVFSTQVRIHQDGKGGRGRIEIEFYSTDDMERILELVQGS